MAKAKLLYLNTCAGLAGKARSAAQGCDNIQVPLTTNN
ncbi:hypothetical protein LT85_4210 [Collimonas arenae]|uniref:Uncharacterized protein n=1 Tax=Collimonas arenae TaxID=279058 RepID=A0A0A1FF39_9BURK|nr:hypothetical protein LT85_4210 [Collimonas arenae]